MPAVEEDAERAERSCGDGLSADVASMRPRRIHRGKVASTAQPVELPLSFNEAAANSPRKAVDEDAHRARKLLQ